MVLTLRALTAEEHATIEHLTRAQRAPVRLVRRARSIERAAQGLPAPAIAQQVGVSETAVRQRLERFSVAGRAGLDDAPRSGRPRTDSADASSRVIAKARELPPKPADGDAGGEREVPPTGHWTLDRLPAALAKEGLSIKRR